METKANYAIVGLFTVIVIFMAFGFVFWMSEYRRGGDMVAMTVRIPGSANGLSVGSAVRFNGIPVGSVRALNFDANDPRFATAMTEIRSDAPVYEDTKAVLEIQGLTGTSYIELSGGDVKKDKILLTARETGVPAKLDAQQSGVTNLLTTASEIMKKTDTTISDIQSFVRTNGEPLTKTISNVATFSDALKENSDGIDKFLESVSSLSGTFTKLSDRLDSTLASVDGLVKSVDPAKVDTIVSNAAKISSDLASATGEIDGTVKRIQSTLDTFDRFGKNADKTLARLDEVMASIDPKKVGESIDDIRVAVADARTAVASVKGVAESIGGRQKDIDTIITDVSQMTDKLNKASSRVDGVLAKIDGFLGSGDSSSMMAEVRGTLESFRKVADTLNARIGPIADNLQKFSGSGLRDVQALVTDTRRTMQNLDTAISKFDNDPQRLLFGGQEVKQYDGRTRR